MLMRKTISLQVLSKKATVRLLLFLLILSENSFSVLAQDISSEAMSNENEVNTSLPPFEYPISSDSPAIIESPIQTVSEITNQTVPEITGNTNIIEPIIDSDSIQYQELVPVSTTTSSVDQSGRQIFIDTGSSFDQVIIMTGSASTGDLIADLVNTNTSLQGFFDPLLVSFDAIDYGLQTLFPDYDRTFSSLRITEPDHIIETDDQGRINTGTIQSYNVIDEKSPMTYCSQVSYLNLKKITGLTGDEIQRGNAIDVRKYSTGEKIQSDLIDVIQKESSLTYNTVFDIVTYKPQKDENTDSYVRQSHRFVVFLGTDDERYVLDPIRTNNLEPLGVQQYIKKYIYDEEILKIVAGYRPSLARNPSTAPIEAYSSMELFAYAQQGLIQPLTAGEIYPSSVILRRAFHYSSLDNTLSASLPVGVEIVTADGKPFDISKFIITEDSSEQSFIPVMAETVSQESQEIQATVMVDGQEMKIPMVMTAEDTFTGDVDPTKSGYTEKAPQLQENTYISSQKEQFHFGIEDQHLIFSKPIQLTQKVDIPDGMIIDIEVKHASDTIFSVDSLSNTAATTCEDGKATIPGSKVAVESGMVTFRTCGASTFSLTYTGGATTGNYVDNGFKEYTLTFATGVQFPTGTTIGDVDVSIDWRPIDNESPTGPWGTTNCYPNEKAFQIYHPDNTVVNLINTSQLSTPNTSCPQVVTTFDDGTPNPVITTTYVTDTYKPTAGQTLSSFNNKSPFGGWKLRMTDNGGADGMILFGFTLSITTNPVIQNNSGSDITTAYAEQSGLPLIDIISTDPNYSEGSGLTYTLSGVDVSKFAINASGIVTWITQPSYDNPTDNGGNNIYDITVIVTNGIGNTDSIGLAISVVRPVGQSCRAKVDLATANTCITTTGGTVQCRGLNSNRQVADGTTTQRLIPTNSTLFGSSIRQVDATQTATFVVTTTGQVRSIGGNTNGQLGDGTLTNRNTPVNVLTGALRVYNTQLHTCAIMNDATVRCRGRNANGQLGDNTTTQRLVPTAVAGGLTGVVDMALQSLSTCALKSDGTVQCRGINTNGRLGDGTLIQRNIPTIVGGGLTGVIQLAGGASHMCALKDNGTVQCRGLNSNGQLGDNSTTQRLVPTAVLGGLTGVVSIAAATSSTCALRYDGTMKCRGLNTNGRLGDNTTTQRLIPTSVVGMTGWSAHQIFAEASVGGHFCASSLTGGLYCRGLNANGQLGDNTTTQRLIPTAVVGGILLDVNHQCPIETAPTIQNNSGNTITGSYQENDIISVVDIDTLDINDSEGSGLIYTLTGVDSALFSINASGVVTWLSSPDFETPLDIGGDNIYNITVVVTNTLGLTDTSDIILTVIDVVEITPIPGCVNRDPRAWYKANDGNYNGTTWIDQSPNGRNADSNGTFFNDPDLTLINFNPSYDFDTTNYWHHKGSPFLHDGSQGSIWYTVGEFKGFKTPFSYLINLTIAGGSIENAGLMADKYIPSYHAYDTDNVGNSIDAYGKDPLNPNHRLLTYQRFKDDVAISENGNKINNQSNSFIPSTYDMMSIGMQHDSGGGWSNPWFGRIPEVILYNDTMGDIDTYNINGDDDERIETYLAVKYGQTLRHNYIDGLSNIIYDINAGYGSNIFGVGREDCEALYQKQSKSENDDALMSISVSNNIATTNTNNTGTIANNNSYLIIGDDLNNISYRSNLNAPSGHEKLQRAWRSESSNFTGDIFISAPAHTSSLATKLPAPMTGVVKLAVDPDGNFSDGNTVLYPMTLVGTEWTVTGITLTGVKYMTFVTEWVAGSLCIESPTIAMTGFVVKNIAQTIDYKTDYFKTIDNRSSDSGYYTTITISNLTGGYGGTILPGSIQRKADPIVTLSGSVNPLVTLGPSIGSYISANSTVVLMKRDLGPNYGLTGNYATKLNLRFSIPAYKNVDTYTGTITYTLYEN